MYSESEVADALYGRVSPQEACERYGAAQHVEEVVQVCV